MKKNILILAIAFCSIGHTFADVTLPAKVNVKLPKIIAKNLISENETNTLQSDRNWGQSDTYVKPWVVYSDRAENQTYTSPDGRSKFTQLEFNEKLFIAKIENGYALVYEEPLQGTFPKISKSAKSKGWVPMKHLLLWSSCPTDEHGIYQKALIAQNMNSGKMNQRAFAYMDPTKTDESNSGTLLAKELKASMDFYFVMKKENGLSLLAKNYILGSTRYMVLYGWVSKSHYVPWNQRSCLEPNWNSEDAEYFKSRNIQAVAYEQKSTNSQAVAKDQYATKRLTDDEASWYRKPATHMRYPILADEGNYYYCTTFAKIDGSVISQSELDKINEAPQIIDTRVDNTNIINIIVVIDGTKSMGEFYKPMKDAITNANAAFGDSKKVRVGAVIYRDNTDKKNGKDFSIEYKSMVSPSDPKLKQFLEYCGEYGPQQASGDGAISSTTDRDLDEALFKGLNVALDAQKMGYTREQSNIMFVIGDCGDHDNLLNGGKDLTKAQKEIVDKMVKNNVQTFAFQVRNLNDASFAKFVTQMNGIIKQNMIVQYGKLGLTGNWKRASGGIVWDISNQKYNYYMGGSFQALNGQAMSGPLLTEYILSSFAEASKHVNKVSNEWEKALAIYGDTISDGAKINMAYYEQFLSKDQINALKLRASVIARNGYAPKKDASDRQYWKLVLYISQPELQTLISNFKGVVLAGETIVKDRKPFLNALKALALAYVGEEQTESLTIDDILKKMSGTIFDESAVTRKYKLKELGDEKIVNNEDFLALVDDFRTKYEHLVNNILNAPTYVGRRYAGGDTQPYFWIPGEDMP